MTRNRILLLLIALLVLCTAWILFSRAEEPSSAASFPPPAEDERPARVPPESTSTLETEPEPPIQPPPTTTVPPATTTTAPPAPPATVSSTYIERGPVDWDRIADCESGERDGAGNPIPGTARWDINTGNGYYGGLQFHHDTWIAYGGGAYSNNAHETSRANQIAIASGMGLGHWPHCGRYG